MKIKEGFTIREMIGDYIIIPLGENALEYAGIITTNEVGKDIWTYLQDEHSEEELFAYMMSIYEVEEEVLRTDIKNMVAKLEEYHLFV